MRNSRKQRRIGQWSARLASASLLALVLSLSITSTAWGQDDPASDPTPAAEPAPAPRAPAATPAPAVTPDPKPASDPAPVVALSPAPKEETALAKLSDEIMNILVPVFGTLISGLVTLLLLWLRKRFKLQVSDEQINSWSKLSRKGALRAAEWARKKAKEAVDDKKIPGPDILEIAVNWALEAGKAAGLPEMGREKLEGWVEAELFDLRREENGSSPATPI